MIPALAFAAAFQYIRIIREAHPVFRAPEDGMGFMFMIFPINKSLEQ